MRGIIIGDGEIGKSLGRVFGEAVYGKHEEPLKSEVDVLHICFPYDGYFESEVKRYQKLYQAKYIVVHSTVPVGTCDRLEAIHSPVIGIHPELERSIKTFIKFLAGPKASEVAQYFRRAGMKVYLFDKSETTEYLKLRCTEKYGLDVRYAQDVKDGCDSLGIPFEAYTLWTENYNEGYKKLDHEEFIRPKLIPMKGQIGGHCVIPNTKMLKTRFTKIVQGD